MGGTGSEDGREPGRGPAPDSDLSARLKRLDAGLDRKRADPAATARTPRSATPAEASALAKGFRISAEFMAGVILGGALGWAFDHYLGTKPWGLVVFLLLGFATGVYNVMRVSGFTQGTGSR
jgi:ATP synthase protein I